MGTMAGAGKKIGIGLGAVLLVGAVVLFATPAGKAIRDIAGTGVVQQALKKHEDLTYVDKDSEANLQSFATALKTYQTSEGVYPDAGRWMDEILPRLILNNLPQKEAEKKFHRPDVAAGGYGYALNDVAAGHYVGDLPKGTILVFESATTERNAHGDPKRDGRPHGRAITIEGTPVSL